MFVQVKGKQPPSAERISLHDAVESQDGDTTVVHIAPTTYSRYVKKAKKAAEAAGQMFNIKSEATKAFIVTSAKARKTYCCRKCKKPITGTGHSRTQNGTYCPEFDGPRDKWMGVENAAEIV